MFINHTRLNNIVKDGDYHQVTQYEVPQGKALA